MSIPFTVLFALLFSYSVQAQESMNLYAKKQRIEYVSTALKSMVETDTSTLEDLYTFLSAMDRNSCRSSLESLRIDCLISAAKENCKSKPKKQQANCEIYSDVVVVNKLAEKRFIKKRERYQIMRQSNNNFRILLLKRLGHKYAGIATEFSLSEMSQCDSDDINCLGGGIDEFCLDFANRNSLSWQYCAGALLWFIGTSKKEVKDG